MKRPASLVMVGVLFGSMSLMSMASSPRFETFRAVDVVRLLASGMCFGAAIVGIVLILRNRQ